MEWWEKMMFPFQSRFSGFASRFRFRQTVLPLEFLFTSLDVTPRRRGLRVPRCANHVGDVKEDGNRSGSVSSKEKEQTLLEHLSLDKNCPLSRLSICNEPDLTSLNRTLELLVAQGNFEISMSKAWVFVFDVLQNKEREKGEPPWNPIKCLPEL